MGSKLLHTQITQQPGLPGNLESCSSQKTRHLLCSRSSLSCSPQSSSSDPSSRICANQQSNKDMTVDVQQLFWAPLAFPLRSTSKSRQTNWCPDVPCRHPIEATRMQELMSHANGCETPCRAVKQGVPKTLFNAVSRRGKKKDLVLVHGSQPPSCMAGYSFPGAAPAPRSLSQASKRAENSHGG